MNIEKSDYMKIISLYEDNHLIVVYKPPGVLSQGGEMKIPNIIDQIKAYLKIKYNKPGNVYLGLVHRLDLNVGGVMVFARTSKAAKRLSEQVRNHNIGKRYLAIAEGRFIKSNGTISDYIKKDEAKRQAFLADKEDGKLAELKYDLLEECMYDDKIYSLLNIELITGRFHQIRFQLSNINHPLLGDTKYGDSEQKEDFFLGLHAYELTFEHPTTKELMTFNYKPEDHRFLLFKSIDDIPWRSE